MLTNVWLVLTNNPHPILLPVWKVERNFIFRAYFHQGDRGVIFETENDLATQGLERDTILLTVHPAFQGPSLELNTWLSNLWRLITASWTFMRVVVIFLQFINF